MNPRFDISPSEAAPQACDPADANTNWEWIREVLAKLGLTVLVAEWPVPMNVCPGPQVAREIGRKLEAAGLGQFDSIKADQLRRFFFTVSVKRLVEALQAVESELRARDLLAGLKIGHAEAEAGIWRTYWPKAGTDSL